MLIVKRFKLDIGSEEDVGREEDRGHGRIEKKQMNNRLLSGCQPHLSTFTSPPSTIVGKSR